VKQYEIRWARMPEPVGLRPVLLLSRSPSYAYLASVLAAEVTTRVRGIAQEVPLASRADGVPKACVIKLDNIHLVATRSLGTLIAIAPGSRPPGYLKALIRISRNRTPAGSRGC